MISENTPWTAEAGGGRGVWIKTATGEWSALACGDTDASAAQHAATIIRAVNGYDALVSALYEITNLPPSDEWDPRRQLIIEIAEDALLQVGEHAR